MSILRRALLTAATIAPMTAAVLDAQTLREVRGVVTDTAGAPVAGARVAALDGSASVLSGASGAFLLRLPDGRMPIVVSHLAFRTDTLGAQASPVRVRLTPAPLAMEALVVSAERNFSTASSQAIRELDIQLRPRESSQELLRLAPGLVIAQHAGGGKAEQIFLRGFDADHGTDVAISVDGLPVNMVSHAHGQGYADLHFVIPELVDRIEVRKGPFDVRDGDFATAGAVLFHTRDRVARPLASVRAGSFRTTHALTVLPMGGDAGRAGGYLAASGLYSDGPFEAAQRHRRLNLFGKWTGPLGREGEWFAQASGFGAGWNASGQVPARAVDAGVIDRFGSLDPSEGGSTARADLSVGVRSVPGANARWEAQLFATRNHFDLFSNFTFFLNDSIHGDGIEQRDDRSLFGGRASYGRENRPLGLGGRWEMGGGIRADGSQINLFHQERRQRLDRWVDDEVGQQQLSTWALQEIGLSERMRLNLGARADLFHFRVNDRLVGVEGDLPHASGRVWRGILSPRANLAFDATRHTTLFLNGGGGFHSNDARDVVLAQPGEEVLPRAWGAEVGARTSWSGGTLAASVWALDLASELVWSGDEGVTETSGRTRRIGSDLEARLRLVPWLWADADLNLARGRFRDEPIGADFVPLAPRITAAAGLTARDLGPAEAGLRVRHIGARPADETNTIRALGYSVWELFGGYRRGSLDLSITVDNLFDTLWNEAQFATTSRLHHEPGDVTELNYTPGAPRGVQVGVGYRF